VGSAWETSPGLSSGSAGIRSGTGFTRSGSPSRIPRKPLSTRWPAPSARGYRVAGYLARFPRHRACDRSGILTELRSADELRGWRRLALTQARFGRRDDASRTISTGIDRCVALAEADPNECVLLRAFRSHFLIGAQRAAEALAVADRAVADGKAKVPGSDALAEALKQRGRALSALGRRDEALAALRESHQLYLAGYPEDHPNPVSIAKLIEQLEAQAPAP